MHVALRVFPFPETSELLVLTMPIASWSGYNLSTVRQPISDIIMSAVELLLSIIDEP